MQPISKAFVALVALLALGAAPATTETIVLVRHGEKPELGLGQLTCQGLNRALALPAVIQRNFGRPAAIYAPDPGVAKDDLGKPYDYVRPLATIEPTAIALGMPIHAAIGVTDIGALQKVLEGAPYLGAVILVGWEHAQIVKLAQALMTEHGGNPAVVPEWKWDDFDSIYVVRITRTEGGSSVAFERRAEQLNGQSTTCPGPAPIK